MGKSILVLKIILALLLLLILGNLVFLDWQIVKEKRKVAEENATTALPTPTATPTLRTNESSPSGEGNCPQACLLAIDQAVKTAPTPTLTITPQSSISSVKEFFVPFGSGSTRSNDWEDITGLAAYIDSTKYGKIKTAVFEAAVYIPDGDQGVYARLYNVTDKHPVWFSEVYHEGGSPKLLVSQPITLDSGNKLYQVQMKTTLRHWANLNQARVKITTE